MRIFLFILFFSLCSCSSNQKVQQRGVYLSARYELDPSPNRCTQNTQSETWAVVIGINNYLDNGIPDLTGAAQDAWNFYHYLTHKYGGSVDPRRVKLLINERANKANIDESLGEFLTKACPKDQVIIYFAGHGAPEPDRPDDAFLLTHDSQLNKLVSTALSMNQLPQFLTWRANSAGRLLFIVDACHSGAILFPGSRGFAPVGNKLRAIEQLRAKSLLSSIATVSKNQTGWGVISSSAPDQVSGEGGGDCKIGDHRYVGGVFTCSLLKAINDHSDENGDGKLSYDELFESISSNLSYLRGSAQVPQRSGNLSGQTSIFQTPKFPIPIPPIAERYIKDYSKKPYRPWLWSTLAITTLGTGLALYFQKSANQQTLELNQFLDDNIGTKTKNAYETQSLRKDRWISQSKWSYFSAGLLGITTAGIAFLDWQSRPPPTFEAYQKTPSFYVGTLKETP